MSFSPQEALQRTIEHREIFFDEMVDLMRQIMRGDVSPMMTAAILTGLRVKKETIDEIAAAATVMREFALAVPVVDSTHLVDIVGTGGDGSHTFNISTCAMFVAAAAGARVAKHGNRSVSSKSGSADAVEALGAAIELQPAQVAAAIEQTGIGFMFAPAHHPAMKHVGPTRVELGTRTMFNLLGPQSNPAGARRYMLGVYDKRWVEPVAAALLANRAVAAWVVHGADGLDELSTTGTSFVATIKGGDLRSFDLNPEDAGLPRASVADLKGADPAYNATRLRALLDGQKDPYRDIVLYNAAAALIVAGRADTLKLGVDLAAREIDSGRARATLDKLIAVSNS